MNVNNIAWSDPDIADIVGTSETDIGPRGPGDAGAPRGERRASDSRRMALPGRTCIIGDTARPSGGSSPEEFPGEQQ